METKFLNFAIAKSMNMTALSIFFVASNSLVSAQESSFAKLQEIKSSQVVHPIDPARNYYLTSNNGGNCQIAGQHVPYFAFIRDRLQQGGKDLGTREKRLTIPLTTAQFNNLINKMRQSLDGMDMGDVYESSDYHLSALAEEIKDAKEMACDTLYGLVQQGLIKKLKLPENLQRFIDDPQFIANFKFSADLERSLARELLTEKDIRELSTFMVIVLLSLNEPSKISFNLSGDHLSVSGTTKQGKGFCDVWDIHDGEKKCCFMQENPIQGDHFLMSPLHATVSDDGVKLWDIATGLIRDKLLAKFDQVNEKFSAFAVSSDLSKIAVGLGKLVIIWDLKYDQTTPLTSADELMPGHVERLLFTANGSRLIEIRSNGMIRLWAMGKVYQTKMQAVGNYSDGFVRKVHYEESDDKLLIISKDGKLFVVDCKLVAETTLKEQRDLKGIGICISSFGDKIVVADDGDGGKILDIATGDASPLRLENKGKIIEGCYDSKDKFLAIAADDKMIYICSPKGGQPLASLSTDSISYELRFSDSGSILASRHADGKLRLWYYCDKKISEYLTSRLRQESKEEQQSGAGLARCLLLALIIDAKKKADTLEFLKKDHLKTIYESLDERLFRRFFKLG